MGLERFLRNIGGWPTRALVLAAALMGSGGCFLGGSESAPGAAPQEIRVGAFLCLSGPEGPFGRSAESGMRLAVEQANGKGGVLGKIVRLFTSDDQCTSSGVKKAVETLLSRDHVQVLLGEVTSTRSLVAAPLAQQAGIPMISPSGTNPRVTRVGSYIFRVSFTDVFQGEVMARFAINILKLKKAAVFYDQESEYSSGLATYFANSYGELGGQVLARETYRSGETDLRPALKRLLSRQPEALYLPGYFTDVGRIAKQARALGYEGVFLGGDGWDSEELTRLGGDAILGSYFSNHFSPEDRNPQVQEFVAAYRTRFGGAPDALAAMGYDATRVALDALARSGGHGGKRLRTELMQTRNFLGATGIITINGSRDAVKPAVVLKVSAPDRYKYVATINP